MSGPDSLALASMTAWWQGFVRSRVSAALHAGGAAPLVEEQAAGAGPTQLRLSRLPLLQLS